MERDTSTAEALYVTNQNAAYDAACKRLLSEKAILARIMKACLEEYKDCDVHDIAEKYIEGTPQISEIPVMPDEPEPVITGMDTADKSVHEGTITYDIRFRALAPGTGKEKGKGRRRRRRLLVLIINVEAQGNFYPGYPLMMRAVFYCCRMISAQYGREFQNAQYQKLKKVCSLWICLNPPPHRRNTITRYRLVEEQMVGKAKEPVQHYDLMSIVMICLGGPKADNYNGILRMLDVLLTNTHSESEKRSILSEEYDIPMTQALEREVSQMCNLSSYVEEQGFARGIEKGILQGRAEGMEKGMQKGILQGRTEGMEKGIEKNTLFSIQSLMETISLSLEQAMTALRVPEGDRQKYRDLLQKS